MTNMETLAMYQQKNASYWSRDMCPLERNHKLKEEKLKITRVELTEEFQERQ